MDWSLLADWTSGIGSLLAVVVALWFSVGDLVNKQKEKYAALTVWVEQDQETDSWMIISVNSTDQPFFKWNCHISYESDSGAKQQEDFGYAEGGILPPGRFEFDWAPVENPKSETNISVDLDFVDSAGRKWRKPSTGRVTRRITRWYY